MNSTTVSVLVLALAPVLACTAPSTEPDDDSDKSDTIADASALDDGAVPQPADAYVSQPDARVVQDAAPDCHAQTGGDCRACVVAQDPVGYQTLLDASYEPCVCGFECSAECTSQCLEPSNTSQECGICIDGLEPESQCKREWISACINDDACTAFLVAFESCGL